jgi:hypothetical protein
MSSICSKVRCSLLSLVLAVFVTLLLIIFIRHTHKRGYFWNSYNEERFITKQPYIRQEVARSCRKKKSYGREILTSRRLLDEQRLLAALQAVDFSREVSNDRTGKVLITLRRCSCKHRCWQKQRALPILCVCVCVCARARDCVCVCACSLTYPACKAHALYHIIILLYLWPVWFYYIFPHYLTNGTIFGGGELLNINVFWLSLQICLKHFSL